MCIRHFAILIFFMRPGDEANNKKTPASDEGVIKQAVRNLLYNHHFFAPSLVRRYSL